MADGFVVGDSGYSLRWMEWLDKEGDCNKVCMAKRQECGFSTENERKCAKNLIGHCCKHVICGNEEEKNIFKKIAKDKRIPDCIIEEKQPVVTEYERISQSVIESAKVVGLSVSGKKVNAFCEGLGDYRGYTAYISYEKPKEKKSEYFISQEYGIVSMYFKNTELDTYWTLYNIYEKYKAGKNGLQGIMICPTVKAYYEEGGELFDIPNIDIVMRMGKMIEPGDEIKKDFSKGALCYFYFLDSNNIGSFYEKLFEIYGDRGENVGNNHEEVGKKLKELIISDSRVYRSKIAREYLDMIAGKQINLDTAIANENAKKEYKMNFKDYLSLKNNFKEFSEYYSAEQAEIEVCCYYFKKMKNDYITHIQKKIKGIIKEMEQNEKYVLSHSDFTAFFVVSSFCYYYMTLCVLANMYNKLTTERKEWINNASILCNIMLVVQESKEEKRVHQDLCESLKAEIVECKHYFSELASIKNDSIKGWYNIFNSLFLLEETKEQLEIKEY